MDEAVVASEEYDRAEALWPTNLLARVRNVSISPNWIGDSDTFWYRHETDAGCEFIIVDAATGARKPAFDHAMVAALLSADAADLPITALDFSLSSNLIGVETAERRFLIDVSAGKANEVELHSPYELANRRGERLFRADNNLWVRDANGESRPITLDGEPFNAWGGTADFDMLSVARSRGVAPAVIRGCFWSPSGERLFTQRTDDRQLEPYAYLESVPADGSPRPKVHFVRQQLAGEAESSRRLWFILDPASERRVEVSWPPAGGDRLTITSAENGGAWWTEDEAVIYVLAASSNADHAALVAIDTETGATRIVYDERCSTFFDFNPYEYNLPNARPLPGGQEFLWYSQADGWGHLYAINLNGGTSRQLTSGRWCVFDVLSITRDQIFFSAGGREAGRDPYYRHLYRLDWTRKEPNARMVLLTPDDADHGLVGPGTPFAELALARTGYRSPISPSGRYFLDSQSTVDQPTVTQLRDENGVFIAEVVRADVSGLNQIGWRPPERFTAKAADGLTDLYGVALKPRDFDPARAWPVVERIYGGPQTVVRPRSFVEGLSSTNTYGQYALAELGFVVIVLDGPGTPYRSKAFHDMTYGQADRWGLRHHRAAIEGAAKSRPWMDISRVGVCGHSYGGYATAMALLLEPDFYKVGVSSSGMYDPMWAQKLTPERHLGRTRFAGGAHTKTRDDEAAENYTPISPSTYAANLTGQLMLAYGDLDENIQPAGLLKLIDSLIKAGKSYDLVYLPGRTHALSAEPYMHKRTWDYFITHLQGRRPLRHRPIGVPVGRSYRL